MGRGSAWVMRVGIALSLAACSSGEDGAQMNAGGGAGTGIAGIGQAGQVGQAGSTLVPTAGVGGALTPTAGAMGVAGMPSAGDPNTTPIAGMDATAGTAGSTDAPVSGDCATQGLNLDGLMYSPGGNTLPHPCEAFHPTTNNPYAVRCVDAWPWYDSGFAGDEYCILPPPEGEGVQIGVHPQGKQWYAQVSQGDLSGYDNATDEFLMNPGEEEEMNYITGATNPNPERYYRSYVRMRSGSHHMIVYHGPSSAQQEVWGPGGPNLNANTRVPGAQRPDQNTPVTLDKPAEDAGLYSDFPAMPSITYNMHHFNSTDGVILKENWTNLWWEHDDATVPLRPISGIDLGILVTAGQTVDLHNVYSVSQPTRVVDLFGHRHAWTPNFSAWVERAGGGTEIVYQSFDWFDQPTFRYDSIAQNPAPSPDLRSDGATSGQLMLNTGDKLHFNCHIAFTDARAAETGAPSPSQVGVLRFANEAFTGEMCILFGSTAGNALGSMSRSTAPPPDFATVE